VNHRHFVAHRPRPVTRHSAFFLFAILLIACNNSTGPDPPSNPDHFTIDTSPAWSPDGREIAYYRFSESSAGPPGIYAITSDGANNRLLMESPVWTRDLRFSPSGRLLSMTIGLEIFIYDLEAGTLNQLTNSRGNAEFGDWSPDSQFIVYEGPFIRSGQPDDGGLHIIEVATEMDSQVLNNNQPVYGLNPRWSPNGDLIAFWSADNAGNHEIFTINADGSNYRRLTNSAGEDAVAEDPRWLNAGSQLLCLWRRQSRPATSETRVMNSDGSGKQQWPFLVRYYDAISFDSQYIVTAAQQDSAFMIDDLPVWVLFVRELNDSQGTSLRQLTAYRPPELRESASSSVIPKGQEVHADVSFQSSVPTRCCQLSASPVLAQAPLTPIIDLVPAIDFGYTRQEHPVMSCEALELGR